jgi:hypothetical protein
VFKNLVRLKQAAGDLLLSQRTADAGLSSWEAVLGEAGVGDHAVSELNISYRVPNDFLHRAHPGDASAGDRARPVTSGGAGRPRRVADRN